MTDQPAEISSREFAELVAELKTNTKAVETLVKLIQGNGTPGLLLRVDRLERATDAACNDTLAERVSRNEREIDEIRKMLNTIARAAWAFVAAFIFFIAGVAWAMLTHQVELRFP